MIPRLGTPPRPSVPHRLRPGAYAVLLSAGRVLLTEQDMGTHREVQLPGGGIDPGEAPLPALHREVFEETGHRCRVLRLIGRYRRFTYMPEYGFHAEKLCSIYLGVAGPRWSAPTEPGHKAIWASHAEAMANLHNHHDRRFVARALLAAVAVSGRQD